VKVEEGLTGKGKGPGKGRYREVHERVLRRVDSEKAPYMYIWE
jgi:hypothetical protein